MTPLLPENAPFTPEQRAWLSGFFAALFGGESAEVKLPAVAQAPAPVGGHDSIASAAAPVAAPPEETVEVTWHDPALSLEARMDLAEGLALPYRLYAAMAQQDCGQCGYLCASYSRALYDGSEEDATLCAPGGRETRRKLKELLLERSAPATDDARQPATVPSEPQAAATVIPGTSRQHPVMARVLASVPLQSGTDERDTRHVVFSLPPEAPTYAPGDALGVMPTNDAVLVQRLLDALGLAGDTLVSAAALQDSAQLLLTRHLDITQPSDECLELMLASAGTAVEREQLSQWLQSGPEEGVDVLELLEQCPATRPDPVRLLASLARLQPRLYSIASSPDAHPGQVELTVGVVRYERGARPRAGVASGCLASALPGRTELPVYVQPSAHFHLPSDPRTPIVMVGPGTGIAPFRGFLQARARLPADTRGPAWLFFGNPHAASDFLYREELEAWLADATLTRLSTAFSRDQAEKIYVQHRMREEGKELWHWLNEQGAYFYVCGDARRMAGDVEAALLAIAGEYGALDTGAARVWLEALTQSGRYLRDVY